MFLIGSLVYFTMEFSLFGLPIVLCYAKSGLSYWRD